jgi:CubicO group peptidase (beta-lactamase class C family)
MTDMNSVMANAVKAGDVPFAVGMVANSGGITFSGAAGDAAPGLPAGEDTVFRIFSMTKAIGSLAAMILIDRGKLSFDTPMASILPAWDDIQVLDGFDGDTPILRAPKTAATVEHLATHTSGLEYEFWNANMAKYLEVTGAAPILSGQRCALQLPLMSDPGTRWGYGTGIDWLGQVVEAVDGRSIDAFCQAEIFDPLGMGKTAFAVRPDMADQLSHVALRGPDGALGPMEIAPPADPEFYGMGHALYSTAPDYMRFLRMMLNRGALDGARLLSEDAISQMLADHMNGLKFLPMHTVTPLSADCDPFPDMRKSHSFGFLRFEGDAPGMRSAGTQGWAGVCNSHYWFDPAKDVAAVIMTQSLPFVEPRFMQTYEAYERAVYAGL